MSEKSALALGADTPAPQTKPRPKNAFPEIEDSEESVFLPDFRGETVASVLRMAARDSIVIEIHGSGLAVDQSPVPGTVVVGRHKLVRVSFSDGGREI